MASSQCSSKGRERMCWELFDNCRLHYTSLSTSPSEMLSCLRCLSKNYSRAVMCLACTVLNSVAGHRKQFASSHVSTQVLGSGLEIQGHPCIHNKFKASLSSYLTSCFKNNANYETDPDVHMKSQD